MITHSDQGPDFDPDDPLAVILRPASDYLGPPPAGTRRSAAAPPAAGCSAPRPGSACRAPSPQSSRCPSSWRHPRHPCPRRCRSLRRPRAVRRSRVLLRPRTILRPRPPRRRRPGPSTPAPPRLPGQTAPAPRAAPKPPRAVGDTDLAGRRGVDGSEHGSPHTGGVAGLTTLAPSHGVARREPGRWRPLPRVRRGRAGAAGCRFRWSR